MVTTVVKSIGTASRDYSTLQAWEDAAPANLVTADQVWKGECYNDSTFTAGVTISGITTDATRYIWLTAAAGQSFADTPSNALDYNAANGVAINTSDTCIYTAVANVKIDKLQISGGVGINDSSGSSAVYIDNCIVKSSHYTTGNGGIMTAGNVSNCVAINVNGGTAVLGFGSAKFFNVTAIQTGSASAFGFRGDYSTPKYTNCAAFGFGTNFRSGYDGTSDCNASSQASPPGAHSLGSLTFSDHFVSSSDYKLKATSTLINAGTATGAPSTDIFGTSRPSGAGYDIGAFEYVAAGGGLSITTELATASASGYAATVNRQSAISSTLATATASGFTANVGTGNAITATLATATASGQTATVNRQSNITATQAVASASGQIATVNRQLAVAATLATATASGQLATVNLQRSVVSTQAVATATGYAASVQLGNDLSISATQAIATASGLDAVINRQLSIAATLTTATASGFDASISNGASIAASYGLASADGYQAQINLHREIAASLAVASASGSTAVISTTTGSAVWPDPADVLSGTTYGPTGADYTGTATAGGYPSAADIAAAVRVNLSAELALIDAAISSRSTVAGILGATVP